jgi:CheY-like chemotaxis protein
MRVLARNSVALILVVDDEYGIAEVLEAALIDAGHEVMTAMNGRQGLDRLRERRPDLVLLDLMMPIMDGTAMLKAIREDPERRDIPVIVMSSLPEGAVAEAARGAYTAFLRKPFKLKAVIDVAKTALSRHASN